MDNPTFHALAGGNRNLSLGNDSVRYFPEEVSPFVGLEDFTAGRFDELARMLPPTQVAVVVSPRPVDMPAHWKVIMHGVGLQMMGDDARPPEGWDSLEFIPLRKRNVPQMVALAALTKPGPFGERTIEFGSFVGVFDGDRLMAISGHRLHPGHFIEISGVCTHPDYSRRGLGAALTYYQVDKIRQMGEVPILHVWKQNAGAIRVYESLGFVTRRELHFTMIRHGGS